MSENYFTGDVKAHQSDDCPIKQQDSSRQQAQTAVQKQLESLNINEATQDQKSQPEPTEFVDVHEVTAEKQQNEDEKFIETNPIIAAQQKQQGNHYYTSGQYVEALACYRKALQYTDQHSQQDQKFRSVIYSNIGLTFMKMNHDESSIQYFQDSLKLNHQYTKARTNLAQCYQNTDKLDEALAEYKKVLEINPSDAYVRQKIVPLEIKVKQKQQKMQEEVIGGLKNIGNSILGYFGMSLDNFKLQKGTGGGYNVQFKQ